MLLPVTRIPSAVARTFSGGLVSSVTSLCSRLPATRKLEKADAFKPPTGTEPNHASFKQIGPHNFFSTVKPAGCSTVQPEISGLFGLKNADRLIGPALLRQLMGRNFSAATGPEVAAPMTYSNEPYLSAIRELEPEFLKAGLVKVYENDENVVFSVGANQALRVFMNKTRQPAIASNFGMAFRDQWANICALNYLVNQLEPDAVIRNIEALHQVRTEYGLYRYDKDVPPAKKEAGLRIYSLLVFRQVIGFLEKHKKALSEILPIPTSASHKLSREPYGSVIQFLEPEFLKAGFRKILENDKTVAFSIGPNQFLRIIVLPENPPAVSFGYVGNKFNLHYVSELMKRFEPAEFEQKLSDLNAIIQQYGLADNDTPKEIREEGSRAYLLMIFRQVMRFVESNRKALAELSPAEIPMSIQPVRETYGSVG